MELRDRHVWLEEGEFLIVPRGVEHRLVAEEESHVMLFEPARIGQKMKEGVSSRFVAKMGDDEKWELCSR